MKENTSGLQYTETSLNVDNLSFTVWQKEVVKMPVTSSALDSKTADWIQFTNRFN